MCNDKKSECNCISEILAVILILQQNANCCGDSCLDTCDRGFLGCGNTTLSCNTRPVMLYTCGSNGVPWSMPITKDSTAECTATTCSPVFKVEKVEGNCATFRVLQTNPDADSTYPYVGTNSIFTMNLDCVCSIRCLSDTYIDCCS